jgi:hypothetical protein
MTIDKIQKLKKDKGTLISIILTVAFGIFAVVTFYISYFKESKPNISINIEYETDIIDVKKPLNDLVVYYKNNDIVKGNLRLQIIRIKFKNTGDLNITNEMYEKNDIWGLQIDGAEILETRLIEASSPYIKNNQKPQRVLKKIISLKKIIFDKDEYYTIELLILFKNNTKYDITSIGKISGIRNKLQVERYIPDNMNVSIFFTAFSGNVKVQLLRFGIYLFGIIVLVVVITLLFIILDEKNGKRKTKKRKIALDTQEPDWIKTNIKYKWIYDYYLNSGNEDLKKINNILRDSRRLKKLYEKYNETKKSATDNFETQSTMIEYGIYDKYKTNVFIGKAIEEKLISLKGNDIIIDEKMKKIINSLLLM